LGGEIIHRDVYLICCGLEKSSNFVLSPPRRQKKGFCQARTKAKFLAQPTPFDFPIRYVESQLLPVIKVEWDVEFDKPKGRGRVIFVPH